MLTKAFWVLIAATAAFVVLTALGWSVMPALAVMILIDILAIEAMRRADMKAINNDLAHTIASRFDSLEKLCNSIASSVLSSRDDILRALGKEPPVQAPTETVDTQAEAVIEPVNIEPVKSEEKKEETAASFTVNYG